MAKAWLAILVVVGAIAMSAIFVPTPSGAFSESVTAIVFVSTIVVAVLPGRQVMPAVVLGFLILDVYLGWALWAGIVEVVSPSSRLVNFYVIWSRVILLLAIMASSFRAPGSDYEKRPLIMRLAAGILIVGASMLYLMA